jgi:AraC-like DNA-binding protein
MAFPERGVAVQFVYYLRPKCLETFPLLEEPDWSVFAVLPEVHYMGTSLFDPYWAREEHANKRHEMLHIIEGRVQQVIGKKSYGAGPDETLLIPTGVRHRDVFDVNLGLKAFMVCFTWGPSEVFFQHVNNEILQKLSSHRKYEIARIIERLRVDSPTTPKADGLMAAVRLHVVLVLLLREAVCVLRHGAKREGTQRRQRRREIMNAAKSFLHEHFCENISLDDVAKYLEVSPFYLSHVFSEESDFTLFHYLTTLRMGKAMKLLQSEKMKVTDVAGAVGYENSNYFARVFKKYYGRSPTQARGEA